MPRGQKRSMGECNVEVMNCGQGSKRRESLTENKTKAQSGSWTSFINKSEYRECRDGHEKCGDEEGPGGWSWRH